MTVIRCDRYNSARKAETEYEYLYDNSQKTSLGRSLGFKNRTAKKERSDCPNHELQLIANLKSDPGEAITIRS